MCGGDDHLAMEAPVSSPSLRSFDQDFLSYTWVYLRAFRAFLVTVRIQYFLIWSPISISSMFSLCIPYLMLHALHDWFFILSVDLPSWVRVERRLLTAVMTSIHEALASLK
ncbi:hypothetical protein AAG906_010423 [Vitis piasezkii]